jgi:hypothetical protein
LADHGKSLTWSAAEYDVDPPPTDTGSLPYRGARKADHRFRQHYAFGEIEFVNRGVDRVDFHRGNDIEPGLLETEAETADA